MVCNKGIYDMPIGWKRESQLNLRIYTLWNAMLHRCYDEKVQEREPWYKGCYVCDRWFILSNFVEDISKIPNYDYWKNHPNERIALDKDIKSNGKNKCYCLEQCQFVTMSENSKQVRKTQEHPRKTKINQYSLDNKFIKTWEYAKLASIELGINYSSLNCCLRGRNKTAGGYIWKYYKEGDENE